MKGDGGSHGSLSSSSACTPPSTSPPPSPVVLGRTGGAGGFTRSAAIVRSTTVEVDYDALATGGKAGTACSVGSGGGGAVGDSDGGGGGGRVGRRLGPGVSVMSAANRLGQLLEREASTADAKPPPPPVTAAAVATASAVTASGADDAPPPVQRYKQVRKRRVTKRPDGRVIKTAVYTVLVPVDAAGVVTGPPATVGPPLLGPM